MYARINMKQHARQPQALGVRIAVQSYTSLANDYTCSVCCFRNLVCGEPRRNKNNIPGSPWRKAPHQDDRYTTGNFWKRLCRGLARNKIRANLAPCSNEFGQCRPELARSRQHFVRFRPNRTRPEHRQITIVAERSWAPHKGPSCSCPSCRLAALFGGRLARRPVRLMRVFSACSRSWCLSYW